MPHDKDAHLDTSTAVPGGELGGTWASPTVDATHSGSAHHTEDHDHDGSPTQTLLAANTHGSPSADTHHAKNHTNTEHPWFVIVRKPTTETISLNQIVQDDDHLFFSIGANEIWVFEMFIVVNSHATPDWKYNIGVPAGATGWNCFLGGATTTLAHGTDSANVSQTGVDRLTSLVGIVVNGGTAGTVQLKWAQNLTDVNNTSVMLNSYLIAQRIA